MTPSELREIRTFLGLDEAGFAAELGYSGSKRNNASLITEYERGKKPIPAYIARLAWLIEDHFMNEDYLPEWPPSCDPLPPKPEGEKRR